MEQNKLEMLREAAKNIRIGVIKGTHAAKSGHPGGSLSMADIMAYLYFEEMNVDPANPNMPDRDRFVPFFSSKIRLIYSNTIYYTANA